VLVVIELETLRVHLAGVTTNPDGRWVTQEARNLLLALDEQGRRIRLLLRDRDAKSCHSVDDVFGAEGIQVLRTPVRAPRADAYVERWIRTVRAECLDWLLIWGRRQLERVLDEYLRHDNDQRPHRRPVAPGGDADHVGGEFDARNLAAHHSLGQQPHGVLRAEPDVSGPGRAGPRRAVQQRTG